MDHQGYYYVIPSELAECRKPVKALLYGLVTSLANNEGYCYATNAFLANKLGMKSERMIRQYISELVKEGWLLLELENYNQRRIYLSTARRENAGGAASKRRGVGVRMPHSNINKYSNKVQPDGIKKELIKYLDTQPTIKNPEKYIDWISEKYGDKYFEKLTKLPVSDWVENLEFWVSREKA